MMNLFVWLVLSFVVYVTTIYILSSRRSKAARTLAMKIAKEQALEESLKGTNVKVIKVYSKEEYNV